MKLFPRHKKILLTIYDFKSCCNNLLWQASGVIRTKEPCQSLEKAGLIEWKTTKPFRGRVSGWRLTPKGKKVTLTILPKWKLSLVVQKKS